jgi:predicted transcriptional regulator
MTLTHTPLSALTAGDLASGEVRAIPVDMTLRQAARELARFNIHGAPVVDEDGRLVGLLSVADFAKWAAQRTDPTTPPPPRACNYQQVVREPNGRETVMCRRAPGACALQRFQERAGGRLAVVCADPHCVATDWQVVELDDMPADDVRHYMTASPLTVASDVPVSELARQLLDRPIDRAIVIDAQEHPIGVVSVTDILRAVAQSDPAGEGNHP